MTDYRRLRQRIVKRDDGRCRYCGEPGTELDHVRARNRNGRDSTDNLVLSCTECNRCKGAEKGFAMRGNVLYYLGEEVHPHGLFGKELMKRVRERRRLRQVRSGLAWAIERYGDEVPSAN